MNLIESTIGKEAFCKLCAWVGGIDYYVPSDRKSNPSIILASVVGDLAADQLVAWAGGSKIYVPSIDIDARRDEVLAMRSRGMTIREISMKYTYVARMSERQVYRLMEE